MTDYTNVFSLTLKRAPSLAFSERTLTPIRTGTRCPRSGMQNSRPCNSVFGVALTNLPTKRSFVQVQLTL